MGYLNVENNHFDSEVGELYVDMLLGKNGYYGQSNKNFMTFKISPVEIGDESFNSIEEEMAKRQPNQGLEGEGACAWCVCFVLSCAWGLRAACRRLRRFLL